MELTTVEKFGFYDCARDVVELLDHLEISKVNVAGVSMGGVIAQQFASDFPGRLDRLILSDSFSEARTVLEKVGAWSNWLTLKVWPSLFSKAFEMAYSQPHMKQAREYFHKAFQKMDPQQVVQARAALNHFDIIDRLPAVDSPTLVLVGDQFGNFAINMARKTAEALSNAEFRVLEGGADGVSLRDPDGVGWPGSSDGRGVADLWARERRPEARLLAPDI